MKLLACILIIAFVANSNGATLQELDSPSQPRKQSKAQKVKSEVMRRGVSEKSRVRVRLRNKIEFNGYITQIDEDSFQLQSDPDRLDDRGPSIRVVTIDYADVEKIRGSPYKDIGKPQSRAARVFKNIGLTIAVVALVGGLIFLEVDKCKRENTC